DDDLSHPPTPVAFQFSDTKGNLSNPARVIIDPGLSEVPKLCKSLAGMDEDKFWASFQTHISRPQPPIDPDEFITVTATLAGAVRTLVKAGSNSVSQTDFDSAYQAWIDGGQVWDDPAGTANPVGLFS